MQKNTSSEVTEKASPALRVRSGVRGGASLENCQNNLAYWKKNYNKWYNEARKKGLV